MDYFCYLCFMFIVVVFCLVSFFALWSHAGKVLTSWLIADCVFMCAFVTFSYVVLGKV